ncbi:FHA domain-containing protein [Bordetella tumulicola]|uniref:SctD/MshK family protein n=1 Tax=Bordetella tumulicola TaxID=1649133 RepID=UPI0039EEFA50
MDERRESLALHIASGMHAGARTRIHENVKYRLGADLDGDLVVRDEGVAPCHMTVEVSNGCVRLESYAESVLIDGLRKLPMGHIAESRLPCRFSIGSVQLRIEDDVSGVGRHDRLARLPWRRGLYANAWLLGLVCLGAMGGYLLLPESGAAKNAQAGTKPDTAHVRLPAPTAQEVRRALQSRLQVAGLQDMAVQVDGSVAEVRGVLPDHSKARWQAVQEWFDLRYGSRYLLRSKMVDVEVPKVAITAVWLGKRPYIVDVEGERHYQGTMLNEGWMLKSIDKRQIVLVRGGQEHIFGL